MKRWYVIQVYAGYEDAIKADIEQKIKQEGLQDFFGDILIPSAKLKQFFDVDDTKDQQLFPGYMFIEAEMTPDVLAFVTSTPRVVRFLGGKEPSPLSKKEIERIVSQVKGEVVVGSQQSDFVEGGEVDISDGPFSGFVGVVAKIDQENEKLTVMVSIFGRMTPVELGFNQVKR